MKYSIKSIMFVTMVTSIGFAAVFNPTPFWMNTLHLLTFGLLAWATAVGVLFSKHRVHSLAFLIVTGIFLMYVADRPDSESAKNIFRRIYTLEAMVGSTDFRVQPENYYDLARYANGKDYFKLEREGGWHEAPAGHFAGRERENAVRPLSIQSEVRRRNFEQIVVHLIAISTGMLAALFAFLVMFPFRRLAKAKDPGLDAA